MLHTHKNDDANKLSNSFMTMKEFLIKNNEKA